MWDVVKCCIKCEIMWNTFKLDLKILINEKQNAGTSFQNSVYFMKFP